MEISNKPVALKTRCGFYTSSLAMSAKNNKRNSSYNDKSIVKIDGAVKEQVFTECKTSKEWKSRWGFILDFDKMCVEEAAKRGICEEKYRKMLSKAYRKPTRKEISFWKQLPAVPVPKTCSGYVGWRSGHAECCLELFGPLYVSPKQTLPPELPMRSILLG